jgi:hypothetical protein
LPSEVHAGPPPELPLDELEPLLLPPPSPLLVASPPSPVDPELVPLELAPLDELAPLLLVVASSPLSSPDPLEPLAPELAPPDVPPDEDPPDPMLLVLLPQPVPNPTAITNESPTQACKVRILAS